MVARNVWIGPCSHSTSSPGLFSRARAVTGVPVSDRQVHSTAVHHGEPQDYGFRRREPPYCYGGILISRRALGVSRGNKW